MLSSGTMTLPTLKSFAAPARGRAEVWRLGLGVLLCLAVYAAVLGLILGGLLVLSWNSGADGYEAYLNISTPRGMLIVLGTFLGMALGPMVAVRVLHGRGVGTLFGRAPVVLRDFVLAFGIAGTVLAVSVVGWSFFYDPVPGLPIERWLLFLPLAILAVLLQTGAEELVFRGYLLQQLAARFRSPLVWAVLPAVLFGLLHADPASAGANAWLVVGAATLFGLYAADLTARTGSIGAAWGFHFANNSLALLVIATEGTLTGLALYLTPYGIADTEVFRIAIPADVAVMTVVWMILRRVLGR